MEYGAIFPRACYAKSGTEIACCRIVLRACYAMSGTDIAYARPRQLACRTGKAVAVSFPMRCPVLA
eukprot:3941573-Rhodomonas_salina.4